MTIAEVSRDEYGERHTVRFEDDCSIVIFHESLTEQAGSFDFIHLSEQDLLSLYAQLNDYFNNKFN